MMSIQNNALATIVLSLLLEGTMQLGQPLNRTNQGRLENLSHTRTLPDSGLIKTSRPTLDHWMGSRNDSASPQARRGNKQSKQVTLLSVLLALAVGLSAVGVVAAVFFVRWKRIKKMKKGFQEEMATICLHDELASEALYSSWKPFMDTNNSNKMKLVIEPPKGPTI